MVDVSTGWRRPSGCLELQVIFRKKDTNYRAVLRKMTYKIRHPMGPHHPVSTNPWIGGYEYTPVDRDSIHDWWIETLFHTVSPKVQLDRVGG